MENRAGELRSFTPDAKAGRIAALAKEAEKEAEKENPTVRKKVRKNPQIVHPRRKARPFRYLRRPI